MIRIKYILICLIVATGILGSFGYLWNLPHRSILTEPAVHISAVKLFHDYRLNEVSANKKYIDKVLEVSGQIRHIKNNKQGDIVITLDAEHMFGVNCTFEETNLLVKPGDEIKVKGLCAGYLTDVVMIRCYLMK